MAQLIQPRHRPLRMTDETGVRFGIASAALVATLAVASLAGVDSTVTALAAILAAGLAGGLLPPFAGACLGVLVWAFFTGFVVNAEGQLTFSGTDLVRLAAFTSVTVLFAGGVRTLAAVDQP